MVPSEERFIHHGTGARHLLGYPIPQPPSGLEPLSSNSFGPILENVGIERSKSLEAAHIPVGVTLVEMVMGNHSYPKYIFF